MLVSDYTEKNALTAEEEEMIEKAVRQKVIFERKKRGEIVDDKTRLFLFSWFLFLLAIDAG